MILKENKNATTVNHVNQQLFTAIIIIKTRLRIELHSIDKHLSE